MAMQIAIGSVSSAGARHSLRAPLAGVARIGASLAVVAAAYLGAAWYGHVPPFGPGGDAPYSRSAVLRAVPFDAPLPYDLALVDAARGTQLPYHVVWTSAAPPDDVAREVNEHLAGSPKWQLADNVPIAGAFTTHLARMQSNGQMTHFAELSVRPSGAGSIVTFDFTPIPVALAPK
jgi:hypothetical protein